MFLYIYIFNGKTQLWNFYIFFAHQYYDFRYKIAYALVVKISIINKHYDLFLLLKLRQTIYRYFYLYFDEKPTKKKKISHYTKASAKMRRKKLFVLNFFFVFLLFLFLSRLNNFYHILFIFLTINYHFFFVVVIEFIF